MPKNMKLSKNKAALASNILVSLAMTIVMTFGMLVVYRGWIPNFLQTWLNNFIVGSCIAVPTGLILVPIIAKWIDRNTLN